MNQPNKAISEAWLDEAIRRLRDAQVAEIPPDLVKSTTDAILSQPKLARHPRRLGSLVLRLSGIAAALLIGLATVAAFLMHSGERVAFAQVIDKAKRAESVELVLIPGRESGEKQGQKCVMQRDKVRVQHPNGVVWIADIKAKECLYLDAHSKTAGRFDLPADMVELWSQKNPMEQLRHVRSEDAEQLGTEVIDGKTAVLFRIRGVKIFEVDSDQGEMLVWVDAKSLLPSRIELRDGELRLMTLKNIRWDSAIDPSLFRIEIPEGYALQSEAAFQRMLRPQTDGNRVKTPAEAFREWRGQNK
jgi:hypothetical protein